MRAAGGRVPYSRSVPLLTTPAVPPGTMTAFDGDDRCQWTSARAVQSDRFRASCSLYAVDGAFIGTLPYLWLER
jgi:hypothetical protein